MILLFILGFFFSIDQVSAKNFPLRIVFFSLLLSAE